MKRAAEKLALEEGFNLSGMKDLLRSTIVVSSYADAQQVLSEIEKEFQLLRKPKNRTNDFPMISRGEPLPADDMRAKDGYTDVLVNVVMPSGVIAEIQINVPEMLAAKEGQGHKLYEAYREAPKESPLGQEIMRSMRGFYVAAFDAAAARHAAAELKNAASSELNSDDARGKPLGTNDAPSSEIPNTLPSGNFTRSSPPNESKNSQPGGNLSGTFIASSPDTTVSQNQESVHNTGTGGDPNATSNGRKGPAGKGPKAPRGPGKGGNAGPVRDGSDQLDFFGDRDLGDGGEGPGQVGPVGPDGVRPQDEGPGKPGNRKSTGPDAGVPAGRDIPAKRGLNYRFGEGDLTYKGSWLVKAAANVDAVELLKKLQTEKRQATPEEQKILARFIGWGASELANNLFSDKLDEKARTLDAYDRAVEGFEKRGNAPMRIDPYSRWQGAPQGYYDALSVLRAADKNFPTWGSPEITREALDKARPPAEVRRWVELRDRLKDALTPEEWKAASRSTQYAHYTSKAIVSSMWRALDRFGFKGGTVLEPGAGIGIFAGLMPEATAFNSSYTGIEFDPITGGILQQLFPDERILVESFIDTKLPKNFYDVAIGNPPFSGTPILADPEYRKLGLKRHDYFFAKTIDRIKPGGLVMFVTSRYTMDKLDDKARAYLAERADLVGAIRLPQTAFKQNAGTDVVTDVLFLRKKVDGETFPHAQPWAKSVPMKVGGSTFPVNEYFHAHPEMVLGLHSDTGKMQNSSEPQYTVLATAGDIEERFAKAVEGLPADIYKPEQGTAAEAAKAREIDFNPKAKKEGNYYLSDAGVLMQREGGQGHRVDGMSAKQVEIIKAAVPLRDALKQAQYDQLNDGDWQSSLAALKKAYKAFVAKHGQVNQFTSRTVKVKIDELDEDGNPTGQKIDDEEVRRTFPILRAIKDDPDWTLLAALENFNEDTGAISESRFLSERTLGKASKPVIETPHDAMLASLNDLGRIDIDDIARRIGLSNDVVIDALGSSVFNDPEAGWVTDDAYLSGNVRRKLDIARAAAKADRKFERNVSALEAAQPAPLVPSQIDAEIGQNWIEGSDYAQFLQETAGVEARIIFTSATRQWKVDVIRGQASMGAIADWGTVDRNAADILEASLSGRPIKVMRTQGSGSNRTTVFDKVATESALEKQGKLRQEFKSWLWRDAERTARLVQKYNDQFNTDVPRKFDGRHLTMPGMSMLTDTFDHVKRGAWRIIQTGNTYLAHAVGSGKTRQMVISAMEQKRLGLIKKPMVIVPNHMLKQFAREWQELYPAARLMVADEAEFHTDNRRRFVSRVALSDLDAVIMTHSSFKLLDLDPAYKAKLIDEQLEFMRAALEEAKASDDTGRSIRVKQIEKRIEAMEDRLKAMADKGSKDANVRFDEMGVDMLYVDEAHEFRKLEFATSRQMKGIQPSGSERAMDLYMKVRWLDEKNPGRSLVMASGTPITNTVAEFYSVQRFMDPNTLEARGMQDFDSWASMFGRPKTALESTAAGKYEPVTRFGEFANVGDMTRMFRRFADVVTADDLAAMLGDRRPKLEGGERVAVMAPKSAAYEAYRKTLEMRMKISRDWKPSKDSPTNPDPMVKIIGDGRLAAIDMRFVDPEAESDPKSKLNLMIDDVIAAYKAGADVEFTKDGKVVPGRGNTMMVFSDLGFGKGVTERRGFNARAWFEKRLRDAGVAPNHVAFMSDYKKSSAKADLFRDMNNGKVRILVGSSKNMGTGVNAQQRLRTLFHLDSPWYPSDLEQREGRIIRAGNMNKTVEVRAYSTKGTYDEVMWKMLANKQRFINQALSGDASVRRIEDLDSQSDFEILSALVAEDPRIMQMAGLQGDIARLERLYVAHEDQRMRFIRETRDAKATIDGNARAMATAEAAAAMVQDLKGDAFVAKAGKATFKERAAWGEALLAAYRDMTARKDATQKIGEISGFDIILVSRLGSTYEARVDLRLPTGAYTLINDGSESPVGMAVRATGALAEVTRWPARLREESKAAAAKIDALSTRLNATFSGQEELASKRQELAEIERQLAAEALAKDKPVEPKDDDPAAGTNLSRGAGGGIALPALKAVAGRISKAMPGLPKVHVLASPAQAPEALRKFIEERGAMGDAEGAFHAGEIYLFASGISDETRAEHVLAEHEAAHAGLAGLLGNGKARAMQAIANQNPAVRKAATARVAQGVSLAEAVEEVLVDIPSRDLARLKGWRALVGKVRDAFKAGGFDRLAAQIDRWLAGHLTEQQKADLFVADLVREARAFVTTRSSGNPLSRNSMALSDGKLSDDLAAQEAWLTREAKGRGYKDIEDLLERNYPLFEKLAALWRQKNPASALLSRAAQSFKPVDVTSESFKRWFGASMIKTSPKMSASARPAVERRLHEAERFIASYSSDIKARQDALRDAEPARASWLSQDIARLEKTRAHYFDVATRERAALATAPEYDGTPVPRVMYHATVSDFSTFKVGKEGAIYLASSPADARKVAEFKFHEGGYLKDEFGIRVPLVESLQILPLYVRAENPWDPSNEAHVAGMVAALEASGEKLPKRSFSLEETGMTFTLRDRVVDGEWEIIESAPAQAYIRSQGHDGFWAKEKDEDGGMNLAVYSANQVKSAISNTGDFSTTNDDIRMSRAAVAGSAPAKTATERAEAIIQNAAGTPKPLDAVAKLLTRVTGIEKVARVFYGLGGRLIDRLTPETVKAGIVSDYGVPEAVIDQRAMMQGRQREQLRQAGALLSKLTTMTRAESRVAYEWMNMEGTDDPRAYVSMMQGLPEESVRVLQEVQGLIDSLSKEAVRLGQLDPEAFKRHRFAYLRRSYYKHAAEMQEGDKAKRQRVISIVGEQYKGRGMVAKAAMRQIQNIAPEWWQRKMVAGKADTALKGEKFIRLEKCAATGEKTTPLDGMEGKARGRILEIAYWPAGEKVPARFADWDNAGTWEVRDVKGADAVMWRDFTKEKREKMGEIDEARYAIAKTLHGMIHDVEVGRYLEWLAKEHALKEGQEIPGVVVEASERYKDTFKPGEWVQVPESQIKGTSVQKYGLLAGRYVPGPIWNDLRQVVGGRFQPLGETYDKILKMWKASKTALSPAVHMNNVMSNFVMADWHDVSAGHVQKALRILLGALERDGAGAIGRAGNLAARLGIGDREAAQAILTRYQDSGGAIGGWLTQEIANDQLEPIVEALKAEIELKAADAGGGEVGVYSALQHLLHARFGAAWEAAKGSKPGQAIGTEGKNLLALYSSEDDVFRLAAWLKAKEEGKTDLEAGKVSRRSFLDYSINAPWVQAARQTALPFISFTYRALPMLLHTAGTKPHKLMKLMALVGALNWLGVMLGGGGDDRERKMLPEEKAGRVWGLVPKLIRMPWNDKHGSPVYLDIRRWIPVGDVADLGQGHSALPIPPSLMPGGPLAVALEVVFNRSMFTGKAIALDTDTVTEHAKKLADHLWKAAMPNVAFIPGTYAWSGISDSLSGRTDTFGRDLSPGMAAANTVGVKLGAYPADVLRRNLMGKANAEIMEIEKNVADLKRQRRTNRITAEELSERIREQVAKEVKVRRELAEKMR